MKNLTNYIELYRFFLEYVELWLSAEDYDEKQSFTYFTDVLHKLIEYGPKFERLIEDIYGVGSIRCKEAKDTIYPEDIITGPGISIQIHFNKIAETLEKTINFVKSLIMEGEIDHIHENSKKSLKILYILANPEKNDPKYLRLENYEEYKDIQSIIEHTIYRDNIQLIPLFASRIGDFESKLSFYKPDILIFSGHGELDKGFVFEDIFSEDYDSYGELIQITKDYKRIIEGVIFNACQTHSIADDVSKDIGFSIGTIPNITNQEAIEFIKGFIESIGNNESIDVCFNRGVRNVKRICKTDPFKLFKGEKFNTEPLINMNTNLYEDNNFMLWILRSQISKETDLIWDKLQALGEYTSPQLGIILDTTMDCIKLYNEKYYLRKTPKKIKIYDNKDNPINLFQTLPFFEEILNSSRGYNKDSISSTTTKNNLP